MRPKTRPNAPLKVVRLPDIKDMPAAVGDWTCENIDSGQFPEMSSRWVKLKLVTGAA